MEEGAPHWSCGGATFDFFEDPSDYLMGLGATTAIQDLGNLNSQVRTDIVADYTNCWYFFGWKRDKKHLAETEPSSLVLMQANRLREAGL